MLENAFRGGKGYWALLGTLGLAILIGFIAWMHQFTEGLHVTGMSRDVTWGLYIAQFTFLVGVAASAVMVVLPYYLHDYKAFGKMVILGEFLAVSAVVSGVSCSNRPRSRARTWWTPCPSSWATVITSRKLPV